MKSLSVVFWPSKKICLLFLDVDASVSTDPWGISASNFFEIPHLFRYHFLCIFRQPIVFFSNKQSKTFESRTNAALILKLTYVFCRYDNLRTFLQPKKANTQNFFKIFTLNIRKKNFFRVVFKIFIRLKHSEQIPNLSLQNEKANYWTAYSKRRKH